MLLPNDPSCPLVGRSVGLSIISWKGREFTLPCSSRTYCSFQNPTTSVCRFNHNHSLNLFFATWLILNHLCTGVASRCSWAWSATTSWSPSGWRTGSTTPTASGSGTGSRCRTTPRHPFCVGWERANRSGEWNFWETIEMVAEPSVWSVLLLMYRRRHKEKLLKIYTRLYE